MAIFTKAKQAEWPATSAKDSERPTPVPPAVVPPAVVPPAAVPPAFVSPAPLPTNQRRMVERKSPELVQFDASGVFVSGILRDVVQVDVAEKNKEGIRTGKVSRCVQYTFFNPDDQKSYKILGTYDINGKISKADIGRYCEITYKGENSDVQRNGNKMKEFKVAFEEKVATFADGSQITDEDIPF